MPYSPKTQPSPIVGHQHSFPSLWLSHMPFFSAGGFHSLGFSYAPSLAFLPLPSNKGSAITLQGESNPSCILSHGIWILSALI